MESNNKGSTMTRDNALKIIRRDNERRLERIRKENTCPNCGYCKDQPSSMSK